MATFEIPAEPGADRVWLLDHPYPSKPTPLAWQKVGSTWSCAVLPGHNLPWLQLLALGTVTDTDPDDVSWLYDLGRFPLRADGEEILDADGNELLTIDGEWASENDRRLAALIVRLVNEHVARHGDKAER